MFRHLQVKLEKEKEKEKHYPITGIWRKQKELMERGGSSVAMADEMQAQVAATVSVKHTGTEDRR